MNDLLYKQDKTTDDVNQLIEQHRKLVYYMLTKFGQLNNHDAESAAWEALWDSINTFDIYATTAFSTYACTVIKNAIYTVLRKQATYRRHECELPCDAEVFVTIITECEDTGYIAKVEKCFQEFITAKTGLTRNILLAWRSSEYSANTVNLAKICRTSPSYVSRVQCTFRAFLSGRVKG